MPRWDLSAAFPSLRSVELKAAFEKVKTDIAHFGYLLDAAELRGSEFSDQLVRDFEDLLNHSNELQKEVRTLNAFIGGHVSVDSRDEEAQALDSELEMASIPLSKLSTRFTAWLGTLPLTQLLQHSQLARDHEYALEKAVESAKHLMSPHEEALATDLFSMAASAWSRLHNNVSSQMEVDVHLNGELKRMPMSMVRNLAYDPAREVRRSAYEAELKAWKQNEVPLAAAMNSIKGTVNTLTGRRGWNSPLDEALFGSNIDRQTFDAMMLAAHESFPAWRRYMNAKAAALGQHKLAFFDLFAPVGETTRAWSFDEAADFVARNFRLYSEKMGEFAERSYRERWIDAESRAGKSDGAFCMWLKDDQSRVMMNFKPSFGSVKTLAHELGHAYHNLCLTPRTPTQRRTPMTLAETASIFCETIIKHAALKDASQSEQIYILEGSLQAACQVTVDITSRFLFEQRVFEAREKRELSASELCEIMLQAQRDTYGDGLDEDFLHPYMWAVKSHYYSGRSFYNFPYMYGMLFGLGLYAQYEQEPESFRSRYDDLLSSTGLADAATLGERFGIDVRTPDFWRSSFAVLNTEIDTFERLV
jgi:pepF/M3 family oligoendopeptidase